MSTNALAAAITAFALTTISTNVAADNNSPERIRNIENAATEIAKIQKAEGANGAFKSIAECYKRELSDAPTLTLKLEACMAQDIIISQITAALYSSMPAAARGMGGVSTPDAVMKAMEDRVVGTMGRFHVPQDDALAFSGIVKTKGVEAYARARAPEQFPEKKN
jgi:hypothetical protein